MPPVALVRPALELAVAVARDGLSAVPPVEPPGLLRPILRFSRMSRLPDSALAVVRRALDDDPAFRSRVAAADRAAEPSLGRASYLFLARPDRWEAELEELVGAIEAAESSARAEADERSAQRRLADVESQLAQVRADLEHEQRRAAEVTAALAREQQARADADAEVDALVARLRSVSLERDAAHRRAARVEAEAERAARSAGAVPPVPAAPEPEPAVPAVDRDRLASALREAEALLGRLRAVVDEAASAIDVNVDADADADGAERAAHAALADADGARREERAPLRLPVALPPGRFEDDPAVAAAIVRTPGLLLLVDGYNSTLKRWPGVPLTEQRARLADALEGLGARTGVAVHVVFDGIGAGGRAPARRRGLQVSFSPEDVEADDVILAVLEATPLDRPVAVVSDDRRVRREAAARGANVLTQDQLFHLLG